MHILRNVLSTVVSFALVAAFCPGLSYASEFVTFDLDTTQTYEVTVTGWTLSYTLSSSDDAESEFEATITAASYDPLASDASTELSIPSSVTPEDDTTVEVTALANYLFYNMANDSASETYDVSGEAGANLTAVTIPATLVDLGERTFMYCDALASVTFADDSTISCISRRAFQGCSSLASVSIPASAAYVSSYAFSGCSSLASVTFEGDGMEFLGSWAFANCTSLTHFEVPPLSGGTTSYRLTSDFGTESAYRLGYYLFEGCSSLSAVTLLPGVSGSDYISQSNSGIFDGTADDFALLIFVSGVTQRGGHASDGSGVGNASNRYYAVSFYDDVTDDENNTTTGEERAADDTYILESDYQALFETGTLISDILSGEAEPFAGIDTDGDGVEDLCTPTGSLPTLDDDMMWADGDSDSLSASATLLEIDQCYPVERSLEYAFVYVPEETVSGDGAWNQDTTTNVIYLVDGIQDISQVDVRFVDGVVVADEDDYTLYFSVLTDEDSETYSSVSASEAWSEGTYKVYAKGTSSSAYAGEKTDETSFTVIQYSFDIDETYVSSSATSVVGNVAIDTQSALSTQALFAVIADANDPQAVLIASWMAGVAGGQAFFTSGTDTASYTFSAIKGASVKRAYVLGGEDAVGSYVMNYLSGMDMSTTQFTVDDVTDASALSIRAFEGLEKLVDMYGYDYTWSTTAIVASGTKNLHTQLFSSLARELVAPVFCTQDDGTLSSTALSDLSSGGFTNVIVAGGSDLVSDDVVSTLESTLGSSVEVSRVADEAENSLETSLAVADALDELTATSTLSTQSDDDGTDDSTDSTDSGDSSDSSDSDDSSDEADSSDETDSSDSSDSSDELTSSIAPTGTTVIASASDAAVVACAMQYAQALSCDFICVSSSTELKSAISVLRSAETASATLIGDFSNIESAFAASAETAEAAGADEVYATISELLAGVYAAFDTTVWAGDSAEVGGIVFMLGSASESQAATFQELLERGIEEVELGAVTYGSATYAYTSVPDSAFSGCDQLAKVSVAEEYSITSIGTSAFSDCTSLASVSLPSVTAVPESAFSGCTSLTSVSLSSATSIGTSAFSGCTKLTSVTFGTLATVGASAFSGCTSLASMTLSSATSIGASAFSGCTKLTSATLSAATSIGTSAFSGCTSLTTFSAAKVTTLATSVLSGCTALQTLSVPAVKSIAASQFSGRTKLASVTISSVTTVGANAFKGCTALKTVALPKATSIGDSAFSGCTALTTTTLSSATSIGVSAFSGCKALKTVALPKATTIGNAAFSGCTALTKVACAKATKIGSKAFFGCKKLAKVSVKAKTIGTAAFQGCTALKTATLSSTTLTAIPASLFSGCKKLKMLTIKSAKVKKVGAGAFKGTAKSLVVKVPKSKVKAYQKLFVKRGLNKKAKVR